METANSEERELASKTRHISRNFIAKHGKSVSLDDMLAELQKHFSQEQMEEVVGCIKWSVAIGSYEVAAKGKRDKLIIKMSEENYAREREAQYSSGFADELETSAARVEGLVRHWPTVGSFREELLRTLLQNAVPDRYHVATGFLYGCDSQFDIIIYDRIEYAPRFRAGDLVVIDRQAVKAIFEVKSTLTAAVLREALDHLDAADPSMDIDAPPIFRGVFAYKSTIRTKKILSVMKEVYGPEGFNGVMLSTLRQIVTTVCVQKATLVLSGVMHSNNKRLVPSLRVVESSLGRTPQVALMFDVLRSYLRGPGPAITDTLPLSWPLFPELTYSVEPVFDGVWGPYFLEDDQPEGIADLYAEADALRRWSDGEAWRLGELRDLHRSKRRAI
ncbi:DUF6602 domain-containing protein [Bradyrhizobium sp. USDA 372]